MVRPLVFLAMALTAIALLFYIVAASTAHWLEHYEANTQVYEGAYSACWRQHDAGIAECRPVNSGCTADISDPIGSVAVTDNCASWRAVRAFIVLAIITCGFALIALYLASFTKLPYTPLRAPALLLSFAAGLFGLMAWAIFVAIARSNTATSDKYTLTDWQYGFSFALLTAGWVLNWLSMPLAAVPFPYHPLAYDRARFAQSAAAYGEGEEAERQRERERQRALAEGGVGAGLWRLFGITPEKRGGYQERWAGQSMEEQQRRREGKGQAESEEREAAGTSTTAGVGRPSGSTTAPTGHAAGGGAGSEVPVQVLRMV